MFTAVNICGLGSKAGKLYKSGSPSFVKWSNLSTDFVDNPCITKQEIYRFFAPVYIVLLHRFKSDLETYRFAAPVSPLYIGLLHRFVGKSFWILTSGRSVGAKFKKFQCKPMGSLHRSVYKYEFG